MRTIVITVLILMIAGWLATRMPAGVAGLGTVPTAHPDDGWRRTDHGWEKRARWSMPGGAANEFTPLKIHPGLLATFQILVSLFALVAALPSQDARTAVVHSSNRSSITGIALPKRC